jgi:hypothetical protein
LVDLNEGGKLHIAATVVYSARKMFVYRRMIQNWTKSAEVHVEHLYDGQHIGDADGDGDIDGVSTGFCFFNPGIDMTSIWSVRNIDPYWNIDDAYSWVYNATKIFYADIDSNNCDEVFISCSEIFRTRVTWYDLDTIYTDKWIHHEIGQNAYAHKVQVGDMYNDGDLDVISGNNGDQGDPKYSPVILFVAGTGKWWEIWQKQQIRTLEGVYNFIIGDIEGDSDLDFFRCDGRMELLMSSGRIKQ